jgi:5-methylcytosine-specific restriction enzyme A
MPWSKESRHKRGYGAAWDRLRKLVMERDKGLCQVSLKKGKVVRATQVDHIVSKAEGKRRGWTDAQIDDLSNLQAICTEEHLIKTETEQGKKKHAPRSIIGADGWPIE